VENLSRINHVRSERSSIKLISVGRLSFEKGYDVLLHAIKILLDKGLSIECNILGVGNEEISLKNIVRDLGLIDNVNFLGFIEDPKEFILASDYFVFSSRYDGFPNAVLESLACGIPIIALNSPGGISEIIQHRRNGWLINELSEQGLAEGIECAINFKWDKGAVIESARRYDLPFILSKYEYIFDSVV
jgi:glycosyltransferase involved in cell wall biosynthesis